jgi:predicted RNase H-like HicB family nuclease
MTKLRYVHWKEEDYHLGYFEDYPDYLTQGETSEELLENLKDLYQDITSGEIPYIKKVDELILA